MRIRTVKPAFFKDEDLGDLPPLTRLLFQGLWLMADRDGRLEDRPRLIKTEVLPYDQCDIESMLDVLDKAGFITRYEGGGRRCIYIPGFKIHQRICGNEVKYPSELPAPPVIENSGINVEATMNQLGSQERERERERSKGKGIGKGKELIYSEKPSGLIIPDELQNDQDAILEWLAYKKERGQGYKGERGLQALWRCFKAIPAERRREAVDYSMANNWSGLFEKKGAFNGKTRIDTGGANNEKNGGGDPDRNEDLAGISKRV
jgi:hypothetical protein